MGSFLWHYFEIFGPFAMHRATGAHGGRGRMSRRSLGQCLPAIAQRWIRIEMRFCICAEFVAGLLTEMTGIPKSKVVPKK